MKDKSRSQEIDRVKQPPLFLPSIQVGAVSGAFGLISGGTAGVIRGTTPVIFAIVSGSQWFGLGTVFWLGRSNFLCYGYNDVASPREKIYASTLAGGLAGGTVGAVMRGRSNVVPGVIMVSLFGLCGQSACNVMDESRKGRGDGEHDERPSLMKRFAEARWSPMQNLSDEQYENLLKEKLLHVDAEIAVIDDKIMELRKAETNSKESSSQR